MVVGKKNVGNYEIREGFFAGFKVFLSKIDKNASRFIYNYLTSGFVWYSTASSLAKFSIAKRAYRQQIN